MPRMVSTLTAYAGSTAGAAAGGRRLPALIILIFVLRGALAIAIVPPWQHPDEPQHLALAHVLARQTRLDLSDRRDLDVEHRILQSMASHGWWHHYDETEPDPLPASFDGVPDHISTTVTAPPAYYLLASAVLSFSGIEDLITQSYALRWMALALAASTLLCLWAGTRRLFGPWVAGGATLLTALHPQFVLMSTAVNPAALVNLCGAVFWWQAARLLTGAPAAASLALLTGATVVGVFTKRAGAPLVLMLATVPIIAWTRGRIGTWRASWPAVVGAAAAVVVIGLLVSVWLWPEVERLGASWSYALRFSWADRARDWVFFRRFTAGLFDSAWLVAGWLRYPAPAVWLTLLRLLVVVAAGGCLVGLRQPAMAAWRTGLVLAVALVALQVAAIYGGIYLNGYGPQGHYLFPIIGPFMALVWIGAHAWWPRQYWAYVSVGVVAFFVVFDAVGWGHVLLPAYLG
jgi:hypothetical protein